MDPVELSRSFFAAVPRYESRSILGVGVTGVVFEAWDNDLESDVAIKVIPWAEGPPEARPAALQQLKSEVLVNRRLKHPSIVRVFDYGDAAGTPYLTMELIRGVSLRRLAAAGQLDVPRVVALLRQIAEACAVAHGLGIVHRHLSPAKVVVQENGRAVVLDFGLGGLQDAALRAHSGTITRPPLYTAPEQLRGEATDGRTDLYALGAVGFELLAGEPPFSPGGALPVTLAHLEAEPDLAPLRARGVPGPLVELVARCLAKTRSARPARAEEVVATLEALEARGYEEPPRPRSRRVLVVDDDALVRKAVRKVVEKEGIEVVEAEDGEKALVALSEKPADLVFLDVVMPIMDGFDALRVIRATPALSRTPVIFLSAHDSRQRRAFAESAGSNGFLEKPVDPPRIRRVVERWLGG